MFNFLLAPNSITAKVGIETVAVIAGVKNFASTHSKQQEKIHERLRKESLDLEVDLDRLYFNEWGEWIYCMPLEEIMGDFDLMERLELAGVRISVCSSIEFHNKA